MEDQKEILLYGFSHSHLDNEWMLEQLRCKKAHLGPGSNRDEDDWLERVSPNHPLLSESYEC